MVELTIGEQGQQMNQFEIDIERAPTQNIHKILLTSWSKLQTHNRVLTSLSGGGRQ